jgi:hypothetical protein
MGRSIGWCCTTASDGRLTLAADARIESTEPLGIDVPPQFLVISDEAIE